MLKKLPTSTNMSYITRYFYREENNNYFSVWTTNKTPAYYNCHLFTSKSHIAAHRSTNIQLQLELQSRC